MTCECIEIINTSLAERNSKLDVGFTFGRDGNPGYTFPALSTSKLNPRNRDRAGAIPTFCPFCGMKYRAAHPDDVAVDRFAAALKAKLAQKRAEGFGGWEDKEACSNGHLSQLLVEHVHKGDPVDIGNLAMMLHQRGEVVADDRERNAAKVEHRRAAEREGR